MVRSVTTKAKQAISDAAQRSVENVRSVAGDAFGVAAKATDVRGRIDDKRACCRTGKTQAIYAGHETGNRHDREQAPAQEKGHEKESRQEENGFETENETARAPVTAQASVDGNRKPDRSR